MCSETPGQPGPWGSTRGGRGGVTGRGGGFLRTQVGGPCSPWPLQAQAVPSEPDREVQGGQGMARGVPPAHP